MFTAELLFQSDCMYLWAHSEPIMQSSLDQLPGRLTSHVWPHSLSESVTSNGDVSISHQEADEAAITEKGGDVCRLFAYHTPNI